MKDGRGNVTGYYRGDGANVGVWVAAEYTPEGRVSQRDWVANTTCTETGTTKCARMGGVPFGCRRGLTQAAVQVTAPAPRYSDEVTAPLVPGVRVGRKPDEAMLPLHDAAVEGVTW